jgi:hypothetical protein
MENPDGAAHRLGPVTRRETDDTKSFHERTGDRLPARWGSDCWSDGCPSRHWAGHCDAHSGHAAIARGEADLVAFGVPFLANPDLPARYRNNASLNPPDQATFYAGEEKGYIDYPALA